MARYAPTFPASLSRIVEPTPGKSHAVSSALRVASGSIVALTDDDVNVSQNWLSELREALVDDDVVLAGGPVDPRWERPAPSWLQLTGHDRLGAPLGLLDYGPVPAPLGDRTLLGSNMAVRRSVLQELGGFSPRLGKLRGTLLSGEDHELCHRIQTAGFEARYLPSARVTHWVPTKRMRLTYFLGWFYWSGITHAVIEEHETGSRANIAQPTLTRKASLDATFLFRQFLGGLGRATAAAVTGRLPGAVDRLLDSAFAAGYAAGRLGLAGTTPAPAPQVVRSL